jgi:hypothetical protein
MWLSVSCCGGGRRVHAAVGLAELDVGTVAPFLSSKIAGKNDSFSLIKQDACF